MTTKLTKAQFGRIIKRIRQEFAWSDTYKAVIQRTRPFPKVNICEGCQRYICRTEEAHALLSAEMPHLEFWEKSVEGSQVDHVTAIGTLSGSLDEAADKIFCDESNLMLLCATCHYWKSQIDREERKEKISLLDKIELEEI